MGFFTFKGGIHPPDNKKITEKKEIKNFKAPEMLYIPLLQHIGTVLNPIVSVGDRVLKGQKIGDSQAFLSVPIHSPISGIVKKIEVLPFTLRGKVNTIVIENDYMEEWIERREIKDYRSLKKEELLELIRENGIVGLGGATFPTHIKLNPPKDKKIDSLLVNGAECEPYLNTNNRLMIEFTDEFIKGIEIVMYLLDLKESIIAVENNKAEAIGILERKLKGRSDIKLAILKTKYPQGGEKQLIKAVLNREVPSGKLPLEVGVVVQNIATLFAIYNAIYNGHPLIEEIVTVSGQGIKEAQNLRVAIGTRLVDILNSVGIDRERSKKLITGGPMMGIAQYTEEVPVIKGLSGILALCKEEINDTRTRACIACGKCVTVCPMKLSPLMYAKLVRFENWDELKTYSLLDCIECGSCQYICPTNRPLTESIRLGKAKLRSMK